ncbi:uncharacterized protein LOC126336435 [Schistocerca gregaria]|uniref:uncharacterized protein LOC126336435 n=1 Tax=Schistocerca gregaria TaxID=7010 RepID=UPI00211E8E24|nr:uncharacterized protein LOC126336435 [Schistocerca gregaria]
MSTKCPAVPWSFHIIFLALVSFSTVTAAYDIRGRKDVTSTNVHDSPPVVVSSATWLDGSLNKPGDVHKEKNFIDNIAELGTSKKVKRSDNGVKVSRPFIVQYNNKQVMSLPGDSPTDALFDFIINTVNAEIVKKKLSQIKIPDIHEKFHKRVGHSTIKGSFVAQKGWFKSLSSLHRTQGISVSKRGSVLAVTAEIQLREMLLGYDEYKAKSVGPKGRVTGEIDHNAIEVKLTADLTGSRCKLVLAGLRFKKLSNPKIQVTGFGKNGWIFAKAVISVTDTFKGKVIPSVEKALSDNFQAVLGRTSCYVE